MLLATLAYASASFEGFRKHKYLISKRVNIRSRQGLCPQYRAKNSVDFTQSEIVEAM